MRFVFINHAAKAPDYICNNQCDVLNRKKGENEKQKLTTSMRDSYPWQMIMLIIKFLSSSKSGVFVLAVVAAYKEIRMKY